MKIAIAGAGYICLSNAVLLAQHHKVAPPLNIMSKKLGLLISVNYFLLMKG